MIIKPFQGKSPKIHPSVWIAENAVIIGDVTIGAEASVWYGCVIRGDTNSIRIGEKTNIQDNTVIHTETVGGPAIIGNRITIGHRAIVHGCTVEDDVLIGMGATLLSYATISSGSIIGANALVRENTVIPSRTVWAGVPAKEIGKVSDEAYARITIGCEHYLELAAAYRQSHAPS